MATTSPTPRPPMPLQKPRTPTINATVVLVAHGSPDADPTSRGARGSGRACDAHRVLLTPLNAGGPPASSDRAFVAQAPWDSTAGCADTLLYRRSREHYCNRCMIDGVISSLASAIVGHQHDRDPDQDLRHGRARCARPPGPRRATRHGKPDRPKTCHRGPGGGRRGSGGCGAHRRRCFRVVRLAHALAGGGAWGLDLQHGGRVQVEHY